ncbi:MAG: SsrA-binding protein SmpB [Epsilonproteobacteria bacterium]|nr:SsrA-binding protein SmpB [Campylobacterota bacterium]
MGKTVARNKKAFHDYEILEKFESGISLVGSEVKAIREGRVNLKDSFVKIIKGEAFLFNAHVSYFSTTNPHYKPDERRTRKLLLHKKEIIKLEMKVAQDGLSIVPISIYFNHKNIAKVQIALAKGKKLHDKRESLKKKQAERETSAAMKGY